MFINYISEMYFIFMFSFSLFHFKEALEEGGLKFKAGTLIRRRRLIRRRVYNVRGSNHLWYVNWTMKYCTTDKSISRIYIFFF